MFDIISVGIVCETGKTPWKYQKTLKLKGAVSPFVFRIHRKWNSTFSAVLKTNDSPWTLFVMTEWIIDLHPGRLVRYVNSFISGIGRVLRFHFLQYKLAASCSLFLRDNKRHGSNTGESAAAQLSLMRTWWRFEAASILFYTWYVYYLYYCNLSCRFVNYSFFSF